MQLNPSEISELIKQKIQQYELPAESRSEGTIVSLTDGISRRLLWHGDEPRT